MHNFNHHIEKYSVKHSTKLKSLCSPLFETFGLNAFYFQCIANNNSYLTLSPNLELLNHYYLEKDFYKINPFIVQSHEINPGIYFDKHIRNSRLQESHTSLENSTGIKCLLRCVRKQDNLCTQFGFGRPTNNSKVDTLVANELPLLMRFIQYFESEMYPVIQDMLHNNIDISQDIIKSPAKLPLTHLDPKTKADFLDQCGHDYATLSQDLSKREIECLKFWAEGYLAKEIGLKLDISQRTVEHYIESAKIKLNCNSKSELTLKTQSLLECRLI